jgi:hypothetical protein
MRETSFDDLVAARICRRVTFAVGAALSALTVGFGLYAANVSNASAERQATAGNSISRQVLHRSMDMMDMKVLPVQKFADRTFAFSK